MNEISLDIILAILSQTVLSIKGTWSLAFAFFVGARYNPRDVNVFWSVCWALLVTVVRLLGYCNRRIVSRGPARLNNGDFVVVTGASSGLGLYLAAALSQTNPILALDIKPMPIKLGNVTFKQVDCSSNAVVQVLNEEKVPKCLINCAGIAKGGTLDLGVARQVFEVNFYGPMQTCGALIPRMAQEGGGLVVNISSSTALVSPRNAGIYASSKAALKIWHESLRQELMATNVKPILVTAGQLDSPMFSSVKSPDEFLAPLVKVTDLGDRILEWLRAGYSGEIVTPAYVWVLPVVLSVLPQSVIDILRKWNGLDRAMDSFNAN